MPIRSSKNYLQVLVILIYAVDWDGQTYIKKVYREEEGLRLVSLNNHYADKFVPYDENPHIIGKIIGNFKPLEV